MPRVRIILEDGEARPFDPFDRSAGERDHKAKSLEQLPDNSPGCERKNLAALQALNLQKEGLVRRGKHPAAGSGDARRSFWQPGRSTISPICINYRA